MRTTSAGAITIENHVGWGHNFFGQSDGYISHDGGCYVQNDYNKLGDKEGHHTRLWQSNSRDRLGRYFVVGDAHRETATGRHCPGDSVYYRINGHSGYDEGAYEIYHGTRGHSDTDGLGHAYFSRIIHRPNKQTYHQCNTDSMRSQVGWNGQQLVYHFDANDGP